MIAEFITLLFPSTCIGCKKKGSALCSACIASIPPAEAPEDPRISAVFAYTPLVGRIVHECKYNKKSAAFEALVRAAVPKVSDILKKVCAPYDIDEDISRNTLPVICFVPIPLSRAHKQKRGFNQSEIAAQTLAHALSHSFPQTFSKVRVAPLLRYTRTTNPQAKIASRAKRKENLYMSMETTREPLQKNTKQKTYIVIDDVTTSGATCIEAMRALNHAGIQQAQAIALAHGYKRKHHASVV